MKNIDFTSAYDKELNSKDNFSWGSDYEGVLEDIESKIEVSKYKIQKYNLYEWMEKSFPKP